jgi:hypothetical protein
MYLADKLKAKWAKILDHEDLPRIEDPHRRAVTAVILENQERALREEKETLLREAAPVNNYGGGNIGAWDPILISLVRRAMPNLIAYDVCGVQPMTGPTGLIFAMRTKYSTQTSDPTLSPINPGGFINNEAFMREADTTFSGAAASNTDPFAVAIGQGMSEQAVEALGSTTGYGNDFQEMAFSIDKVAVNAKSRALKAEYTMELAQDLKAIHGLDAETELANILSTEILAEINREVIRTLYFIALQGAQTGTATKGTFDLDVDSNGRWTVEKFKGLLFQMEREANQIAKTTRRGKGNFVICSSDVASALAMSGILNYAPALSTNLNVDDTGNTFAGILNGRYKVFVDPYFSTSDGTELMMVGYKGVSPYDAGFFYCPYIPLQMVRAVGENTFQPKIGFKTRYGMVQNPYYGNLSVNSGGQVTGGGAIASQSNPYYRLVKVLNLM